MQYGIYPTIQSVTENEIMDVLVANQTSLVMREVGRKTLCLEIYNDISIPRVIGANEEQLFIHNGFIL